MFAPRNDNKKDDDGDGRELCEADVLAASAQYDVALVYSVALRSRALTQLGGALARCASLTVLDVSRNALTTLCGVEATATTLRVLCACENALVEVAALAPCRLLERVSLEGNQLPADRTTVTQAAMTTRARRQHAATMASNNNGDGSSSSGSSDALSVLATLPCLCEVWLQRRVPIRVDNNNDSNDADDVVVLDNPLCSVDAAHYRHRVAALLSHVRWVDGVCMRNDDDDDDDNKSSNTLSLSSAHVQQKLRDMNAQALRCVQADNNKNNNNNNNNNNDNDDDAARAVHELQLLLQGTSAFCAQLLAT